MESGSAKRVRASDGSAASPAAVAPADPEQAAGAMESEVPTAEERAAMESLGITHLLDPEQQEAFLRRVMETGSAPSAEVSADVAGLMGAAESGDIAALRSALDACSVDAKGEDEDTPLHLACLHGHLPAVQELLSRGANVNVRDEDDSTPLHDACAGGYVEIATLLIEGNGLNHPGGAEVNAADSDGETPLHLACNGNHASVVALLLKHGADATVKNEANRLAITLSRDPAVVAAFQAAS